MQGFGQTKGEFWPNFWTQGTKQKAWNKNEWVEGKPTASWSQCESENLLKSDEEKWGQKDFEANKPWRFLN